MILTRKSASVLALLYMLFVFPAWVQGAELKNFQWEQGSGALALHFDYRPNFTHATVEGGRKHRLFFEQTSFDDSSVAATLEGRDIVDSVTATAVGADEAFVDIDLNIPGRLAIEAAPYGYRINVIQSEAIATGIEQAVAAATDESAQQFENRINDILIAPLPGGRVQININTQIRPADPGVFKTTNPARVALDFFGTQNNVGKNLIPVSNGAVESVAVVETADRTRVVLNLIRSVAYESKIDDNGMVLVVESPAEGTAPPVEVTTQFDRRGEGADYAVRRVDFRRAKSGGGNIIVELSRPGVVVDVKQKGTELIADFLETSVEASLEKRLNVVDFATPVHTIDTFANGPNTRMVITSAAGEFDHLAYQTGSTFTIQVSLPPIDEEQEVVDEFGYSGEKLSLNFQKIGVREALGVLADFTGVNFVTSDSVEGDLTLRLQDVPWDQALDVILQSKGLAKREKGNVIWVAPATEIEERERAVLESQKAVVELEPLTSELIQVNYAKANDIAEILKSIKTLDTGVKQSLFGSVSIQNQQTEANSLLSSRGNVTVDERTNTLLVQDTAGKIKEIRALIAKLDRPVRQVMIETRIIEANDDFSRTLGARLGFTRVTQDAQFPGVSGSNIGDVVISGNIENTNATQAPEVDAFGNPILPPSTVVNLPAAGLGNDPASAIAFTISKIGNGFQHLIDLEISALQAEGNGKIVANPRLVTADQKEAHIEQGQERIFTTTVLGVGSVVTKKAVLGLTVTPQITPDDRLVLDVFITKDSFVSPVDPTINTKQVRTQVLLENGETVVIGGVYEQEETNSVTKVPILGDLPLIGNLFKKRSKSDQRTELLVFLTPRILSPALNL